MKKIIIIATIGMTVLGICIFSAMHLWIEHTIKNNIKMALSKYHGSAEDALISYLKDNKNTPADRSHIAAWTLGQIKSEKALPILYEYYKDDPEGNTCYGKHTTELCQYEMHKAIVAIKE